MRIPPNSRRSRGDAMARSPQAQRRGFQIGPRIRIGGSVGKVGQKIKIGAGKALSNKFLDAGLALIPGVGPGISAAANAAGHVLDTSNGGIHSVGDLGHMALDAGEAYLGGKAANMARDAVLSHVGSAAGTAIGTKVPVGGGGAAAPAGGGSSWWDRAKGIFSGGGSDGQGNFGVLGDLAGKVGGGAGSLFGGGAGSLLDKGLMAASIADAAAQRKRNQDLQAQGLKYATDAYSANAPLRDKGRSMLLSQTAPDLSGIFGNDPNPYAKRYTVGSAVPVGGA